MALAPLHVSYYVDGDPNQRPPNLDMCAIYNDAKKRWGGPPLQQLRPVLKLSFFEGDQPRAAADGHSNRLGPVVSQGFVEITEVVSSPYKGARKVPSQAISTMHIAWDRDSQTPISFLTAGECFRLRWGQGEGEGQSSL